jgi:hypothetical protein
MHNGVSCAAAAEARVDANDLRPAVLQVEKEEWNGDRLDFRIEALGQSASGAMDVADDQVRVELHLPWLLQRLSGSLRGAIQTRGRILLENKPRD